MIERTSLLWTILNSGRKRFITLRPDVEVSQDDDGDEDGPAADADDRIDADQEHQTLLQRASHLEKVLSVIYTCDFIVKFHGAFL